MHFRIFTLHPDIFTSFADNSLIARGLAQQVISLETVNWREKHGAGKRRQVDDKPYGGGSGMVLQGEPIYGALAEYNAVSPLFAEPREMTEYAKLYPNNADFFEYAAKHPEHTSATISLTPRGHRYTQQTAEWLASRFETINLVCGRYEGFDARVDKAFDLELSLGDFVLNGGETASMCVVESVARLVPGFVTKDTSVLHDSFSSGGNYYSEAHEYIVGTHRLRQKPSLRQTPTRATTVQNLFSNEEWLREIAPHIEHPQFTRPEVWRNIRIPQVLLDGDHKKIQESRTRWLSNSSPKNLPLEVN